MIILGTNSIKDTGYDVANSARFNRASSDYLNRTPSSEGNKRTMTFSFWLKRTQITAESYFIYSAGADASNRDAIMFANQSLRVISQRNDTTYWLRNTTRLFRDSSAWSHIVIAIDTTQGTDSNRIKIYINGVQETAFETYAWGSAYPSQNFDTYFNDDISQAIGSYSQSSGNHHDGYISEFVMIDGTALDATSFGEFDEDSGILKPIDVSGLTFGTNGFYLDFENSGALGNDAAGSNNFTVNNLTAIDQSTDTCTNNFSTMNPLSSVNSTNFTEGNLKINLATNDDTAFSSIAVSKGKWYWEEKRSTQGGRGYTGVCSFDVPEMGGNAGRDASSDFAYTDQNGVMQVSSGATSNSNTKGSALSSGDIICYAFDIDNGQLWTSVNQNINISGTANATGLTTGKDYFYFFEDSGSGSTTIEVNFGSPTFSISSGNTDGNGYGNFEYAVPSSYYSLNTKNLAEYG